MKTVLLVDNESHVLRLMKMGLSRAGYHVMTARNGQQGLGIFRKRQPDAMVANIDMPIMNGMEMCSRIKAEFPDTACRIYVSSARSEPGLRNDIAALGNIELLEKPVSVRALTARLAQKLCA